MTKEVNKPCHCAHHGHGNDLQISKNEGENLGHHPDQSEDAPSPEGTKQARIHITQMDCPVEEKLIRAKLEQMDTVRSLNFNLIQRVLTINYEKDALDSIIETIKKLGFEPQLEIANQPKINTQDKTYKAQYWMNIFAGLMAVLAEITHFTNLPKGVSFGFAVIAVASCGLKTYRKGWISLKNFDLNINALMSIAVTGALIIGQWPEAAMVMVLFNIAELIESKSLDRARQSISALMSLTPKMAQVLQQDDTWRETEVNLVKPNDIVQIKPGERIGLDGIITKGRTTVNQAPITGESLPVDKKEGDSIYSGSINETGLFEYKVTLLASDSTVARIIHAVEEAQATKAPIQRFVDQFSRIYTPVVILIAVLIAILPPLAGMGSWSEWVYKALVILVIACPCALVISTPITIVSGLTAAVRQGILIKGGVYLELGRKLKILALDKTGTITHGKPVLTDIVLLEGTDKTQIVSIAASLAKNSSHPVSQAVVNYASDFFLVKVYNFEEIAGKGIKGEIDWQTYSLGNARLTEETVTFDLSTQDKVKTLESQGKTVIILNDGVAVLGLFAIADTVKDTSKQAIETLHRMGVKTVMLTGDNDTTAQTIASIVGIDEALGNQLPENKFEAIKHYTQQNITGMVGDGINDAPALAAADIGFAMGSLGSDTAIETADVALMDDDLRKIPSFIDLSKKTHRVVIENISFALGIKLVFLVLTFIGIGTMWMAVFADVGASLIVVANGLRLLKKS